MGRPAFLVSLRGGANLALAITPKNRDGASLEAVGRPYTPRGITCIGIVRMDSKNREKTGRLTF